MEVKIAIGGMQKNEMELAVKKADPQIETIITNDLNASKLLKSGEADYYLGACGGSAISILIGLVGYSKCATVCKNGQRPNKDEIIKAVKDGKICFGMTVSSITDTVPILIDALKNK